MSTIKPGIEPGLDSIVADCMAKEPGDRYQSAAEVARNIRRFRKDSGSKSGKTSHISSQPRLPGKSIITIERISWSLLVLILGVLVVTGIPRQQSDTSPLIRFTVTPPENSTINQLALSPRGTFLAFTATGGGKTLLWVRRMDETAPRSLEGTEGAAFPFWSPDEQYIGFFASGKLKKTSIARGTPVIICDAPDGRGASWNESGTIIFAPFANDALYRVSAGGGTPQALTKLDTSAHDQQHIWPVFLPDGEQFLYSSRRFNDDRSAIHLASLSTHQDKTLLVSEGNVSLALPGYVLFLKEGTLMAQKFDFASAELSGSPSPVAENVSQVPLFGVGSYSVSLNGVLAIGGGRSTSRQYTWFDRHGKRLGTVGQPGNYFDITVSPDEKRAAIQFNDIQSKNSDIWIIDLASGAMSRFTFEETFEDNPVWSPDGEFIAYSSITDTGSVLFKKASSGKGTAERLEGDGSPYSWSPDGQYLLYTPEGHAVGTVGAMLLPMKGRSKPSLLVRNAQEPQFSPDGKWIAYASNESGRFEVYVQTFPASGGKWQISTNGGSQPRWNPNGKELFFVSAEKILMSVNVQTGTTFRNGIPVPLFETKIDNYESPNRYVVLDHGQRFLINVQEEGEPVNPVTIVVNWTKDLENNGE